MSETIEEYFLPPPPEARLWRFVDFARFVSMLEHRGLFATRAVRFADPFEGSYPRSLIQSGPPTLIRLPELARFNRHVVLASCWHENEHESAALWNLYAPGSGIAVLTRAGSLGSALPSGTFLGRVRYLDYEKDMFPGRNTLYPFIHKRRSFEHEREVRVLVWQHEYLPVGTLSEASAPRDAGIWLPTGLDFIDEIRVAPNAPDFFEEAVRAITEKYELGIKVHRSDLEADPLF